MTDILFPPDLIPVSMLFGVDDFTAVDESATTGAMQSSTLFGTRRWRLRMDFPVLAGAGLARFEALVASLRGRQNRVWISPLRAPRGSFPDVELLPNNTFANGTTGWSTFNAQSVLSAQDRTLRNKRVAPSASYGMTGGATLALSIPYAVRAMVIAGAGLSAFRLNIVNSSWFVDVSFGAGNYCALAGVPAIAGVAGLGLYENTATGGVAGDFYDVPWTSVARCALVDNGANLALWSDDFSNAAWTKTACSITVNAATAADGTLTADAIVDTAVNTGHFVQQMVTCGAATQDITGYATLENAAKAWAFMQLGSATGSVSVYVNLSTGVMGTVATGAGWLNARATMANVGGNKYRVCLTGYKTSADTTCYVDIGPAAADTVIAYLGTAVAATYIWRAGISQSSTATIGVQTSTVAITTQVQAGNLLRLKGLPASTSGLLLVGDMVEIDLPTNSQLVRVTGRLDSDAAGLGVLQFENALKQSPVDGAAVIVQQPMGRFVLAGSTLGVEYTPGVFGQASLEFVEAA